MLTLLPEGVEIGVTTTVVTAGCTSTFIVAIGPFVIEAVMRAEHGEPATQGEGEGAILTFPPLQMKPALSQAPPQTMPLELMLAMALLLEL